MALDGLLFSDVTRVEVNRMHFDFSSRGIGIMFLNQRLGPHFSSEIRVFQNASRNRTPRAVVLRGAKTP